jgi:uncharacterized damage-inducible protein DinB
MIQSAADFIKYFEGVRRRTMNYIRVVPADRLGWSPKEGEFSCADILRHIIAAERMFVRVVIEDRWKYEDHETGHKQSLDELTASLETTHAEVMDRLKQLPDQDLNEPRFGPKREGQPIKAWRWLMVMAEHEIHHRSQLAVYLSLMGVQPPHIFGLGVEDLIALSASIPPKKET